MLRYCNLPTQSNEAQNLTCLTVDEFTALVHSFEEAFLSYMSEWALHGWHRQVRRYITYKNCPLPTAEEWLRFILVYLKLDFGHSPRNQVAGKWQDAEGFMAGAWEAA